MSFPSPRGPRPERRASDRRTGAERRATDRRVIVDRRYSSDRRSSGGPRFNVETPLEHIRNAMQMLVAVMTNPDAPPTGDAARRIEGALERLTRALGALETERRR